KEDIVKVFPVKVKLNNNRIIRQSGAFLIFGIKDLKSKLEPAILPPSVIVAELKIDKTAKKEILKSLDSLAINESTLFPELEHAASYLRT
ncbi:MAG: FRG domain-containing protein, partial [Bacteroidia bacterium]